MKERLQRLKEEEKIYVNEHLSIFMYFKNEELET